jgi:HSP20 family protein
MDMFSEPETNQDENNKENLIDENSNEPTSVISWRLSVRRPHTFHPSTDLYEIDDKFIVRIEIAGMNKEEFCVSLENNVLIVSGNRPDMNLKRSFHQIEIPFGDFKTSIDLPSVVDADNVTAEYRDGFLNIHLPKVLPTIIQIKE